MAGSLRNNSTNHNHHYSFVSRMMSSPVVAGRVVILVESGDDKRAYDPLFISSAVMIQPAPEEGVRGCAFVESVTDTILTQKPAAWIIGIRDADYTHWMQGYTCPANVFRTEERDMEMMLLRSERVREALDRLKQGTSATLDRVVRDICVPRGKMRLLNDVLDLQCSFSDNAKISNLWVDNRLRSDWSTYMQSNFIRNCVGRYHNRRFNARDYQTEVSVRHLDEIPEYKICQGHDVMHALMYELADSRIDVNRMLKQMTENYPVADFHATTLYADLLQYSQDRGWHILK